VFGDKEKILLLQDNNRRTCIWLGKYVWEKDKTMQRLGEAGREMGQGWVDDGWM
jgi:hypothetical protein